jgi:hypothetical protein
MDIILRDSAGVRLASGASIRQAVEAGDYTVLVNARGPSGGDYSVRADFSAEPGMLCTAFANLGLGQTVTSTLGASGCIAPDSTPYEGYAVSTFGSGSLTLSVSTTDFTAGVALRDAFGRVIASGAPTVTADVADDSQYVVVVTTSDKSGVFQLTTTFQSADGETCTLRKTFSGADHVTGTITTDSCLHTLADSGDQTYYDYYAISVSTPGWASVTISGSSFSPQLELLDAAGNTLAADVAGGTAAGHAQARVYLQPGMYTAQVFSQNPAGGAYTFDYSFTAGAPQACTPVALDPATASTATLDDSSCRVPAGAAGVYQVKLPAAGTLTLAMTSGDFQPMVGIGDNKDNLLALDTNGFGSGISQIAADLPAGVYNVYAISASGRGAYQLKPTFSAHDLASCAPPQMLDINGGYVQRLGPNSCRGAAGQPVDYYSFTLSGAATVAAFMTSVEVDGYLSLQDQDGNQLRSDDNSYGDGDPLIVQYLPAGSYRLAARSAAPGEMGLYEVDLRTTNGSRPPFCNPQTGLAPGGTVQGTLSYTSCQYIDATFADIYSFTLAAPSFIDMQLDSADFDAYLVILDGKGNVIAEDDNSGGGSNARISQNLDAGTYFIVVKPVSDYLSVGNYTLTVSPAQ